MKQNHTILVNGTSTLLDNWEEWMSDLQILFTTICAVATVCGQVAIINYIGQHAPIERPINKLVLIDQV